MPDPKHMTHKNIRKYFLMILNSLKILYISNTIFYYFMNTIFSYMFNAEFTSCENNSLQ